MKSIELPGVTIKEWYGSEIGVSGLNVKTTGRVTAPDFQDLHGCQELLIAGTLVLTGGSSPTVGDVVLEVTLFDEKGVQLGDPIALATLSHRATGVTVKGLYGWSLYLAPKYLGVLTGTVTATSDILRALGHAKFGVNRTVAYDGASTAVLTIDAIRARCQWKS